MLPRETMKKFLEKEQLMRKVLKVMSQIKKIVCQKNVYWVNGKCANQSHNLYLFKNTSKTIVLPWLDLRQLLTWMSFQTEDINFRLSIRHSPNSSNNYDHFSTSSDILHWVAFTGRIIEGRQISLTTVMSHIVGNRPLTFWSHTEKS